VPLLRSLPPVLGVALWHVDLDASFDDALRAELDPHELDRAERFVFERDRRRYLNGRHALRRLLGQQLSTAPCGLRIAANAYGKPELISHPGLAFNVSHSQGQGVIALLTPAAGKWQAVGVDVEVGPAPSDANGLAESAFDPSDASTLADITDPAAHGAAFWRGWTRREAALKAIGTGFGRDDVRLITTLGDEPVRLDAQVGPARWQLLLDSRLEPGLGAIAVAVGRLQSAGGTSSR
jgi:4'-phosphopantetheinyl transferase